MKHADLVVGNLYAHIRHDHIYKVKLLSKEKTAQRKTEGSWTEYGHWSPAYPIEMWNEEYVQKFMDGSSEVIPAQWKEGAYFAKDFHAPWSEEHDAMLQAERDKAAALARDRSAFQERQDTINAWIVENVGPEAGEATLGTTHEQLSNADDTLQRDDTGNVLYKRTTTVTLPVEVLESLLVRLGQLAEVEK